MIGVTETALLSYEIQPHEHVVAVKTSKLEKANANAKYFDLCLQDTVSDYWTERAADNEQLSYHPMIRIRFPCFGWGVRKRLTYTIALSKSVSTRITVDALIVPTSWWVDDCEGTYWVIQMTHAGRIPESITPLIVELGYKERVVGWTADATTG